MAALVTASGMYPFFNIHNVNNNESRGGTMHCERRCLDNTLRVS